MELHRASGRADLGLGLALTTMALWSLLPPALKIVLRELDAPTITWFRFGVAALVVAALLAQRGALPRLGELRPPGWGLLAVATVFLAANYLSFLVGLDRTGAAQAQVLIQLAHPLLALGGIFVFGERFQGAQWLGLPVLLCGLALFFAARLRAGAGLAGADDYLSGSLWILAAALTWAVYGLAQKQLLRWLPSQSVMLCIYAGCALLFLPLATPGALARMDALGLGMLLFCALNTVVAYGTFAEALVHWEASRVSAVFALTPLGTLAVAWLGHRFFPGLVDAEPITPIAAAGAALVVGGSLFVALGARTSSAAEAVAASGQPELRQARS